PLHTVLNVPKHDTEMELFFTASPNLLTHSLEINDFCDPVSHNIYTSHTAFQNFELLLMQYTTK
ncbi:hypothetical protein, partial [Acinetobacter oleivorans]|uniref:hypothetical protein n=1 Tax=Acinetobacter oleivorans TaxID=1148157 RepID=UPI001C08D3A2